MIDFINVSKTYPNGTHALYGITLSIDKGEFVFIVGASGAGKSTFLKLIMHEETPTSGKIVINDTDVTKLKRSKVPYMRRHMGIVFQDFRLIDKMNVFDNVAFAMRAVGKPSAVIKKRVPYVLELVGLKDKMKNRPSELSGGEQQRVSLARALVNNPEIIIADEQDLRQGEHDHDDGDDRAASEAFADAGNDRLGGLQSAHCGHSRLRLLQDSSP